MHCASLECSQRVAILRATRLLAKRFDAGRFVEFPRPCKAFYASKSALSSLVVFGIHFPLAFFVPGDTRSAYGQTSKLFPIRCCNLSKSGDGRAWHLGGRRLPTASKIRDRTRSRFWPRRLEELAQIRLRIGSASPNGPIKRKALPLPFQLESSAPFFVFRGSCELVRSACQRPTVLGADHPTADCSP